ncbi:hypothetical protein KIN34_01600 [Cellulomonas sp. DKR-3]|uniref:ATPase BadF/BadG/BcrA/BcrD type domain-containing protein n=1 Tax=Cellulomonas fulva TaxID=2835530 RepID=A0ABS5TUZ9_9CELL|nr:BadF/BadG/BcrA/BcrD ATPase family protein [Cellulomonas fulva]MBT0992985.1 hypothetical protein [Cellulomonas fulva]
MTELYLGLDAGNSKTVALVADADGSVVGWGRAGVGDIYGLTGARSAGEQVVLAVRSALAVAGADPSSVVSAAFRLAGVDWDEDREFWEELLDDELPEITHRTVRNDGFALLRWGQPDGVGVAVTAGTGPAVAARGPAGEFAGSWWIHDDLGGVAMGRAAFKAVMSAHVGFTPPTTLTDRLVAHEKVADAEELLWQYTRRVEPRDFHHLKSAARIVLAEAEAGDDAAARIVSDHAHAFARYAELAARRVGLSGEADVPVVLGGSLLTSSMSIFRDAVTRYVAELIPGARVASLGGSPAAGALLDALAEGGVPITDALRGTVMASPIPPDLFVT